MTGARHQQIAPTAASLGLWLRNAVLVLLMGLLGFCCYFVYRLSMVAYRMEQSVVAVSADVKQVSSTVALLSKDVTEIREEVRRFKEKAQDSVPIEELQHAVDDALTVSKSLKTETPALPTQSEKEISAILQALLWSGCRAEVSGKNQSVAVLYARIYPKYKLMKNTLKSTEDFIEKVADKSTFGHTYYLIDGDGTRTPLSQWLRNRLAKIRAAGVPPMDATCVPPDAEEHE